MKEKIITLTVNPAIDKTVSIDNFKVGHDFREQDLSISAGGKGINVSRVLKSLGLDSLASGFIGGHDGQFLVGLLKEEKIKHDFCRIKANTRTSLTVIDPLSKTITRVLERGPEVTKQEISLLEKKISLLEKQAKYLIISGRNVPGCNTNFYGKIIKQAKNKNIFTVLDTSSDSFKLALKAKPDMIKPNLDEAEQFLKRQLNTVEDIKSAAYSFFNLGIKNVAITMGSAGAVLFNGQELILATVPKIIRKNPVGCGDAFIAGFIASFQRSEEFTECIKMASAVAAANALSIAPGMVKKKDLSQILKEVKIKSLV